MILKDRVMPTLAWWGGVVSIFGQNQVKNQAGAFFAFSGSYRQVLRAQTQGSTEESVGPSLLPPSASWSRILQAVASFHFKAYCSQLACLSFLQA